MAISVSHLTPLPDKCQRVAWHTSLDIQVYYHTGDRANTLMIGGKVVGDDHPVQTLVYLCRLTKGQAKRIVAQRWGISIG